MKQKSAVIFLAILFFLQSNFAQGEAAVPFLVLQQSPQFTGAAQVGVAVPPIDAMGFYLNPAVLGETSREFNFTTMFQPSKTEWLHFSEPTFSTFGLSLGYNFENSFLNIPLSIGIGFIKNKLDYGEFIRASSQSTEKLIFEPYDEFSSFSVGLSYEYYLIFSAGVTTKSFESKLTDLPTENESIAGVVNDNAFDYGFLITAPISELFYGDFKFLTKDNWSIKPKTNISIGYSVSNIGDEISYLDPDQSDPIPRTARFGYNVNLGFDFVDSDFQMNLFDYYFIVEAEDILVNKRTEQNLEISYQSGFGDIDLGKQLINLEGTEKVILRKAHMFRLLETVTLSVGRFDGRGFYPVRKTNGLSVSTTGLSKYLSANFENAVIQFIAKHISIEYYSSTLFEDWMGETEMEGVGIILKNFSF